MRAAASEGGLSRRLKSGIAFGKVVAIQIGIFVSF
jgi:hypothetical protein